MASFDLLPGNYRFRIDKNGTKFYTADANHCAAPGCTAVSYVIPAPVAVTVTGSAGGPEAGLKVYAFDGDVYAKKSVTTDSNGVASFDLLPGNYRFRIDKNGTKFYTGDANHCAAPGCTAVSYEIPEAVLVTVTNSAGAAEEGLKVYAFDGDVYAKKSVTTDSNGVASFDLLPGNYRFRIDKNGTKFYTGDANHCAAPGCSSVDYVVPEPVVVTVTGAGGIAEEGLKVYAFDGDSYAKKSATTDSNGEAVLTLLPGHYRFRIDKDGEKFFTEQANHCAVPDCNSVEYSFAGAAGLGVVYEYNALGQRISKTVAGQTTDYIYDLNGQLLAEIDRATGETLKEYLYLDGQPLALVDASQDGSESLYYVHNDHLNTPQKLTDQNQQVVWAADYQPFGEVALNEDVDGDGQALEFNLRFPGQYFDRETGTYYNYYRDYDPSTGRYIQSDPIGLGGGLNTYAYVLGNPLKYSDPTGESPLGGVFGQVAKDIQSMTGKDPRSNNASEGEQRCKQSCFKEVAKKCRPATLSPTLKGGLLDGGGALICTVVERRRCTNKCKDCPQ